MDGPSIPSLPFLTRDMLKFGSSAKLQVQIKSQANTAGTLKIRLVSRDGFSEYSHTTNSDGSVASDTFGIADIPILLTVKDDASAFKQGDCFITLSLLIDGEVIYELCAGFVYSEKGISWPPSGGNDAFPGHGRIKIVTLTDVDDGSDLVQLVPSGRVWRVLSFTFEFTADSTSANRNLQVTFGGGAGTVAVISIPPTITANGDYRINLAPFGYTDASAVNGVINVSIPPDLYLPSGTGIEVSGEEGSTDSYFNTGLLIEEFFVAP